MVHPAPPLYPRPGHFPTFQSAVEGIASGGELAALRKAAAQRKPKPDLQIPGPRPRRQTGPAYNDRLGAWTLPFMGERGRGSPAAGSRPADGHCLLELAAQRSRWSAVCVLRPAAAAGQGLCLLCTTWLGMK